FDAIRKQTGLRFLYNAEQMKEVPKVSVDAKQKKVKDVLTEVLAGTPLTYEYDKDVVTLVKRNVANSEPQVKLIQVTGRVVDEKGNPIPGATVLIQGTSQGVATDVEGRYTINVRPTDALRVSFVGYKTEVVELKGKTKINIRLNPTAENIEEVTVVAFGEQKKESVVSAITTVDVKQLKSSSSDLTTQFAGKIPGMIAWQTGIPGR
ncbi:MAG: carboxypeptidase-like regulatory domain-containing protein, partial [Butyricimonas faecalis]